MAATHSAALASLKRTAPWLQDSIHRELADGLLAHGVVSPDSDGGVVRAAADKTTRLPLPMSINAAAAKHPELIDKLNHIKTWARTLRVQLDPSKIIDVMALDRALVGQPTEERLRFKCALASLNLVPTY